MEKQFVVSGLKELPQVSEALLPIIRERKNIALIGEIGAGKTTFVKTLCKKLGVAEITASPTFAIINEYKASEFNVNHIDLYRLTTVEEAIDIGVLELLDEEHYCFIEWPNLLVDYLPEDIVWIKISTQISGERLFEVFYED